MEKVESEPHARDKAKMLYLYRARELRSSQSGRARAKSSLGGRARG